MESAAARGRSVEAEVGKRSSTAMARQRVRDAMAVLLKGQFLGPKVASFSPMPFLEGRYLYILSGANCESFSPAGEPVASCSRLARIRSLPGDLRPSRSRSVVP